MNSVDQLIEARILVDSYGANGPLVRLAMLASPACRIEPQLIRRLRLECVSDADVSVEQELWHSELVNARGTTITFRAAVARVLRERLREWRRQERSLAERARRVMAGLHADLPPLLVLEDELAWAEVFDDKETIDTGAEELLRSLLAKRNGLDHWLGRAWSKLPNALKGSPQGRQLAQVAAARGAVVAEETDKPMGDQVAHLLPVVPLPMTLQGLRLTVNVPPAEATHVIDIPETHPRCVSVVSDRNTQDLVFAASEARAVDLTPGLVLLRTLSGAEYEIEARPVSAGTASKGGSSTVFEIEMLPAGAGMSLNIRYGGPNVTHSIIVDCGTRRTGLQLAERSRQSDTRTDVIELLVITHIDDDRIGGAIPLLQDEQFAARLKDVWFNGSRQVAVVIGGGLL